MKVPKPRRLKNGKYYIYLRLGDHPISITDISERACIRAAQLAKAEYLSGKRTQPTPAMPSATVGELVDDYIDSRSNVLSPSTIRGYRIIRRTRFQALMDTKADALTQDMLQRMINTEPCAPKSLRNAWALVSRAITSKAGIKYDVRLPQTIKKEKAYLTPDQIDAFCEAVQGTSVEIPALLGLCSLRCSEILGLRWSDVDTAHSCVHVRGAVVPNEHNRFVRKDTAKNASSIRTVPIMPQLVAALDAAPRTGEMVCSYTESWLYRSINKVCEAYSLPKVGIHGLRHSFASLAYHLGMPEHLCMAIGGWADESTVRKIYRHIADVDRQNAVNQMQEFYAEQGKRKQKRKPTENIG